MATQHSTCCLSGTQKRSMGHHVPTLNGLSTFGETREEALTNTREAILGYLEAAEKDGIPLPDPAELVDLEVAVG